MALEDLKSTFSDENGTLEQWFGSPKNSETPKIVADGLKASSYSDPNNPNIDKMDKT